VLLTAVLTAALALSGAAQAQDPVARLSARQLAGQRVIEGLSGTTPSGALLRRVRRGEVAGVILFSRNVGSRGQVRTLVRALQRQPRPAGLRDPLLVMIDQEGGAVKRLPGAPSRSAAQLGRIGSRRLARRSGVATARNLRDYRVNVDLAPVLDVGRPGSFQRRTGRSFGGSPRTVGRIGGAFASGLQTGGAIGALKHFPGLGRVSRDQDLLVQRVPISRTKLRGFDMAPFRAALRASRPMVMTSTALYPALDRRRPALLSRAITTGELRRRMGFRGVVITDDLDVPALRRYGGAGTLGTSAVRAGNDVLLYASGGGTGPAGAATVARALRAGKLDRAAFIASVRRILALRERLR
jgi:beta-N-acetylhexosaminidase